MGEIAQSKPIFSINCLPHFAIFECKGRHPSRSESKNGRWINSEEGRWAHFVGGTMENRGKLMLNSQGRSKLVKIAKKSTIKGENGPKNENSKLGWKSDKSPNVQQLDLGEYEE